MLTRARMATARPRPTPSAELLPFNQQKLHDLKKYI